MKKAKVTHQNSSYIAEFLPTKEYEVYGVIKKNPQYYTSRFDHTYNNLHNKKLRRMLSWSNPSKYTALINSNNALKVFDCIKNG